MDKRRPPSLAKWLKTSDQGRPLGERLTLYKQLFHKKLLTPRKLKRYIKPRGRAGNRTEAARTKAKRIYYKLHGSGDLAACQVCGGPMHRSQANAMHKRKKSLGRRELDGKGGDSPENFIIGHGHQLGATSCHAWADETPERIRVMTESPVNVITGGRIEWEKEQQQSLNQRLRERSHPSRLQWHRTSASSGPG